MKHLKKMFRYGMIHFDSLSPLPFLKTSTAFKDSAVYTRDKVKFDKQTSSWRFNDISVLRANTANL